MIDIKPIRIQRSRQHKQVSPNGLPIVYVGRPSKWGNPFTIKDAGNIHNALVWYNSHLRELMNTKAIDVSELKGKNLSCWCKIGEPCHADELLRIANEANNQNK